jgi:hypothetical protein
MKVPSVRLPFAGLSLMRYPSLIPPLKVKSFPEKIPGKDEDVVPPVAYTKPAGLISIELPES